MIAYAEKEVLPPPLKWAGGKRWLIPTLADLYSRHRDLTFVDMFCGGLSVSLGLTPEKVIINDVNRPLIALYRCLQRGFVIDFPQIYTSVEYAKNRKAFNTALKNQDSLQNDELLAGLFYYLNRTGFNGLCRFNGKGEYNVPVGRYSSINYRYDFTEYSPVMKDWEIHLGDFQDFQLPEGSFVYADPPYDTPFTHYSPGGFSWDDQVRLVETLSEHAGPVVASNQGTERIIDLYKAAGFTIRLLDAPRRLAGNGDRAPAKEILAYKGVSI